MVTLHPVAMLLARRPSWKVSEFAEFPALPRDADEAQRDDFLIAGGLALVLSRCPRHAVPRRFRAAIRVYEALKRGGGRRDGLTPELVSDASHEVAEFVDQATRDALRRRMRSLADRT